MDAHLDTLTDEMSQVTTRVGRIAWRQARLGGFVSSHSPSPQALEDEDDDDSSGDDDDDEDASSFGDEEMIAFQWLALCHLWQKGRVILGMRVVMYLGGELAYDLFVKGSVFIFLRDVVRTYVSFLFFLF